jgi:uncharacterized RDD family membrane protein YckC
MSHSLPAQNPSQADGNPDRLYATFPRRLYAMTIDSAFVLGLFLLLAIIAASAERGVAARGAMVAVCAIVLLLYEPLFVAYAGGTFGHRLMNLRVVDDNTGGNVSLARALARVVLKGLLGVLSFVGMAFTRRHQAFHDRWTSSSVQMRDPVRAKPYHYVREGEPLIPRVPPN